MKQMKVFRMMTALQFARLQLGNPHIMTALVLTDYPILALLCRKVLRATHTT